MDNLQQMLNYWGMHAPLSSIPSKKEDFFVPKSWQSQLNRLIYYCQKEKGLTYVKSRPNHGKTSLIKWLYESLPRVSLEMLVFSLTANKSEKKWLFREVTKQLGINSAHDADPQTAMEETLKQLSHRSIVTSIVIDNATLIDNEYSFHDILGLKNLAELAGIYLNIVLFVDEQWVIEKPKLFCNAYQMIELAPITFEDATELTHHLLTKSGVKKSIFSEKALHRVHECSRGLVGVICDNMEKLLFEAFMARLNNISEQFVMETLREPSYDILQKTPIVNRRKEHKNKRLDINSLRPSDLGKRQRKKPKIEIKDLFLNEEIDEFT